MKQTFASYQTLSRADKIKATVVLILMGSLLILLGFLVGTLLRQRSFAFSIPSRAVRAAPTSLIPVTAPTSFEQISDCDFSTLLLGTTTFEIQNLARGTDDALSIPADTTGIAYRIQGAGNHAVFILSPTPQNITVMSTISIGSAVNLTATDCASATYSLSAPQAGALDESAFSGQAEREITIFFPTASSGAGFIFKGKRVTESIIALNQPTPVVQNTLPTALTNTIPATLEAGSITPTVVSTRQSLASPTVQRIVPTSTSAIPTPDYSEVLAEIGILDTQRSLFGASLKIEVSIHNLGNIPISLSEGAVSLTQLDGTVLALKSSNPNFPAEIQLGETKTVELNFEMPSSPTATLKILTVEYEMEGY